jgi:type I restriction enzyme S subunit
MKLQPYPEYKDSGVPWLGKIPVHWSEKRAKYYFKEIDRRSETGAEEMLSVSHITGVTPRSQKNVTMFKAESNVGQKLCQPGDLIINTMWAWMAALGVSNYVGIVSPSYGVYRPNNSKDYESIYLNYLLRIEGYRSEYICRSTGIRSSRLRLYPDKFLSMPIICPSMEEQSAITRFLKSQDYLFLKFIRNKRRLIELLKEQTQNIINKAVTRGIESDVKLKPSGVEWIGDIPAHWEVRKLKFASKMIVGGATPASGQAEFWDGDVVWVTPQDVSKYDRLFSSIRKLTLAGAGSCSTVMVPPRSVIVTSRAPVGNVSIAEVELCTNQGCKAVIPDAQHMLSEYCFALLKFMQPVFQRAANGTTFFEISTWAFENIKVPLPSIDEQRVILEHILEKSVEIAQAIARAEREIELMHEYRTRLISDVVTGQVDVRHIEVADVAGDDLAVLDNSADDVDGFEASEVSELDDEIEG